MWWVLKIFNQFSTCLLLHSFVVWVYNQASQDLFCLGDLPHEFPEKRCFWDDKIFLQCQIVQIKNCKSIQPGKKLSVTFKEYFQFIITFAKAPETSTRFLSSANSQLLDSIKKSRLTNLRLASKSSGFQRRPQICYKISQLIGILLNKLQIN